MRTKLVTFGLTAVATLALALSASQQAIAQGNANKPAATKKKAPPPKAEQAKPAPTPAGAAQQTMAAKPKPKPKPKRKALSAEDARMEVSRCIKHLQKLASNDPLIPYKGDDGHDPWTIVNKYLLFDDRETKVKSPCSIYDAFEVPSETFNTLRRKLGYGGTVTAKVGPPPLWVIIGTDRSESGDLATAWYNKKERAVRDILEELEKLTAK